MNRVREWWHTTVLHHHASWATDRDRRHINYRCDCGATWRTR